MDSCPPNTSARNDGTPQNNVDDKSMLVRSDRLFFIFLTSFLFYFHSASNSLSTGHAKSGAAPVTQPSGAHRLVAPAFFLTILGRCNDGVDVFELSRNSGSLADAPLVASGR